MCQIKKRFPKRTDSPRFEGRFDYAAIGTVSKSRLGFATKPSQGKSRLVLVSYGG